MLISYCVIVSDCLCFFFFKQKTAYEMRISDWSSDVCSSDLEQERTDQLLQVQQRGIRRPDGGGRGGLGPRPAGDDSARSRGSGHGGSAGRADLLLCLQAARVADGGGLGRQRAGQAPDPLPRPEAVSRSEEHTSELQSLMHTSY